jgi:hypothetical protein
VRSQEQLLFSWVRDGVHSERNMRFVPTIVHGVADYVVGLCVIALPFYFGLTSTQRFAFVAMGTLVILSL